MFSKRKTFSHLPTKRFFLRKHSHSNSPRDTTDSVPIKSYNYTVKLFASRSRARNISLSTAKISKYHILENSNTGQDVCHEIINTDIGLSNCYKNITFDNIIPLLSPILELFKRYHNRCNYHRKLKYIVRRDNEKYAKKQKYKNEIHVRSLQSFFGLLLYENIPLELFGTRHNLKAVKKAVRCLLRTVPKPTRITKAYKRTVKETNSICASFNIQSLLKKLDISTITWLHPIENNAQKWVITLKLLHWFFARYIIKILHKYVVLTSMKGQWVYVGKDDWCKMQEEFLKIKEDSGSLVTPANSDESRWILPIGLYKFIPTSSGLRALLIIKYKTKETFDDIDVVFRFLQQLYITYFNEKGIPNQTSCREMIFRYKKSTNEPLYFVRCDIQDAFGSILQEKLFDIIITCCKELPIYFALRAYSLRKSKGNYKRNDNRNFTKSIHMAQTVQFLNLARSVRKCACIIERKPKLVKVAKLLAKIKQLIFGQKVRINGKVYSIKCGVPQGVRVSSILAEIYYRHMCKEIFSVYESNGALSMFVDDILYVTENQYYAERFLEVVKKGVPEYNVQFNPNKLHSNVDLQYAEQNMDVVKYLGQRIKLSKQVRH